MANKKQRLVLSIIEFLQQSITDGTVKADDQEGLEVAIQCIGEAFGVDPTDEQQRQRLSIAPASLPSIFDVFLKTRDKLSAGGAVSPSTSSPCCSRSHTHLRATRRHLQLALPQPPHPPLHPQHSNNLPLPTKLPPRNTNRPGTHT